MTESEPSFRPQIETIFRPQKRIGHESRLNIFSNFKYGVKNLSTVAQMAERAPQDRKVPSSNPALDPMRHASKSNVFDITLVTDIQGLYNIPHSLTGMRIRIRARPRAT